MHEQNRCTSTYKMVQQHNNYTGKKENPLKEVEDTHESSFGWKSSSQFPTGTESRSFYFGRPSLTMVRLRCFKWRRKNCILQLWQIIIPIKGFGCILKFTNPWKCVRSQHYQHFAISSSFYEYSNLFGILLSLWPQ